MLTVSASCLAPIGAACQRMFADVIVQTKVKRTVVANSSSASFGFSRFWASSIETGFLVTSPA